LVSEAPALGLRVLAVAKRKKAGSSTLLVSFQVYFVGRRGGIKSDSSQFLTGSGLNVSRRSGYPDYAERAHAVLSREGGSTSLGLGEVERP
jgi:hypothetical protein